MDREWTQKETANEERCESKNQEEIDSTKIRALEFTNSLEMVAISQYFLTIDFVVLSLERAYQVVFVLMGLYSWIAHTTTNMA